jgi:predicted Zn finger-like uncharacterized protein
MKFTCDKCSKKYGIDNQKLENYGPSFKIKCQTCNHIIVVTNPYSKKNPISSSKEWYLFINNEQIGPISLEEIKEYIDNGQLLFSTLVWKNGMADWKQAQTIDELKHLIKLPIRTSERRKSQSEKLNMLYDEFGKSKKEDNLKNEINENEFDEGEKTLTRDEFNEKLNKTKKEEGGKDQNIEPLQKEVGVATQNIEPIQQEEIVVDDDYEASVSSDDFFNKDFEEKKEDKDSKLLRSLTGNSSMGNTGIFVMYNQKRKQERLVFFIVLSIVLVVGISTILFFKNKDPKTIVQEKIKTEIKYKDKVKVVKEIKYVEVKGDDGKVRKVKVKTDDTNKNTPENLIKEDVKKDTVNLYGDRNLGSNTIKKVAIKSKALNIGAPSGNYGKDVAKVVSESKQGINWCYQRALKAEPDLVAKVSFKLKISSTGRVNSMTSKFIPSKYNDGKMANCMENKIKQWKFPINPDGESIDFNFSIALKAN